MKSSVSRLILPALSFSAILHAGQIDAIYAFGDSLSDAGNVYALTSGTLPGNPYSAGRFTNGNVWVQDLAGQLGVPPLTPSVTGGNDYAYGSAQSGLTLFNSSSPFPSFDLTGATGQVAQFQAAHPVADPNALYTIWIGSNDLAAITSSDPTAVGTDLSQVAGNIVSAIGTLAGEGAQNFLIVDVPDLGKTPEALAGGPTAAAGASALAAEFDYTVLPAALSTVSGVKLSVLDSFGLVDGIVANPSAYGFSDVSDACVTGVNYTTYSGGTPCATPNSYLFWDREHPTAAADTLLAGAAEQLVAPEPSSLALIAIGALGLLIVRRRASPAAL